MTGSQAWRVVTAAAAGFAADLPDRLEDARGAGVLPNLHGVVAARGGDIFLERYFTGPDAARARPLGIVRFGPDTLHDLRSVTKSVVALLYGIALDRGQVPPPEAPLLAQFPEYPDLGADAARQRLLVRHALSMTLGTEWDELTLPYYDPRNSEIAMDAAEDRCRYVLDRPIVGPPGERWTYNGGATALLARLIARGTGMKLEDFARAALFDPLGIGATEWVQGRDGVAIAASGLRMTARDLARIGVAVLAGGRHDGRQVIPATWLAASLAPAVTMPDGRNYGWHWYLGAVPVDDGAGGVRWERTVSAMGNGGQRVFLVPGLDITLVVTAGNYDAQEQWRPPLVVLRDVVMAGFAG